MARRITDEARRCLAAFEDETGATATDCVVDEEYDRVVILVDPDEMGKAIGRDGRHVEAVEDRLGREVKLVEAGDTPERLVANALAPAAVYNVTISEGDEDDPPVAYVEVDDADRGVAIGAGGKTIDAARLLAERHFGVEDVELT